MTFIRIIAVLIILFLTFLYTVYRNNIVPQMYMDNGGIAIITAWRTYIWRGLTPDMALNIAYNAPYFSTIELIHKPLRYCNNSCFELYPYDDEYIYIDYLGHRFSVYAFKSYDSMRSFYDMQIPTNADYAVYYNKITPSEQSYDAVFMMK